MVSQPIVTAEHGRANDLILTLQADGEQLNVVPKLNEGSQRLSNLTCLPLVKMRKYLKMCWAVTVQK